MKSEDWANVGPDGVLDFWFPDDGHWNDMESHGNFWMWRMQGGADDDIIARFGDLTVAAAMGFLDHWVDGPMGRLALLIVLDQFPRSLWRGKAAAFGQDLKSNALVRAAYANGDYDALPHVWQKQFFLIADTHCEGPDHLDRIDRAIERADALVEEAPEQIKDLYKAGSQQPRIVRQVIERFGRHAHRNADLGRVSTPDEQAYVANGKFPHNRTREDFENDM